MSQKVLLSKVSKIQFVGLALILAAYSFGVFKESFWSDDYPALLDTESVTNHLIKDARPTAAVFFSISYQLLNSPSNAWFLRFLALVALLLIFLFLSKQINAGKNQNYAVLSIAIAFCLPSFQMYIHWSITWFYLWAALASITSYHFWTSKRVSGKILAVLLLVAALTTYPPTALFFFSAICVINTLNEVKIEKFFIQIIRGALLLAISGVLAVLTVVATLKLTSLPPNNRVSLLTLSELPEKVYWLFSRPIVVGLRPFAIDSPSAKVALLTSIPILLLLILGIWRQSQNLDESVLMRSICVVAPLLITLTPLLITNDNQIEFRVLPGYSWGVASLAAFYVSTLIRAKFQDSNLTRNLKVTFSSCILFALAMVSITSINSHYVDLFQRPYQLKNAFLEAEIVDCSSRGAFRAVVILPPTRPFPVLPRLGVFSMSTDLASSWVPKPNLELILRQLKINVPVSYLESRPLQSDASGRNCTIDLELFRELLIKSPN